MHGTKGSAGFTLYELLATIAVAAIIASIGIPSYQNLMQNSRSVTHTNDLVTALNFGRSEAIRRGQPIDVCASSDGVNCSGSDDWSTGWIVRTPAGEVLRTWPERSGGGAVLTANVSTIQFQARGALPAVAAPLLTVQLPHCTGAGRRNISVNVAGRIAVDRVDCL